MEVAIEDNSITLMSLVTPYQIGRTLSKRTCSGIVLALLLLCSIMFFSEIKRAMVVSSYLHSHERERF